MKEAVRWLGSEVLYRTGLLHLANWRRVKRGYPGIVITFHCVSPREHPYFRPGMDVPVDQFRQILELLPRCYRLVHFDDLSAALKEPGHKPVAAVTFDDGYRCVHDVAFPILRELGVPATVFLPTEYIGTGRMLWWDEVHHLAEKAPERVLGFTGAADPDGAVNMMKYLDVGTRESLLAAMRESAGDVSPPQRLMLNWDEVRTMAGAGVRFGGHTLSHAYLDALNLDEMRRELREGRNVIERETGTAPAAFAYPDGRFDRAVVAETRAAGYTAAGTTISAPCRAGGDPLLLGRFDGSFPFTAGSARVRWPVLWSELLGVWDMLFARRARHPERFSRKRPRAKLPVSA